MLKAAAILAASLYRNFLVGLEEDHRADGQFQGGCFAGALTSQGSCRRKRQLLEMEAESFVHWSTGDWTKVSQVTCHLLMGLISGLEGGKRGATACNTQTLAGVFRVTVLQTYFF